MPLFLIQCACMFLFMGLIVILTGRIDFIIVEKKRDVDYCQMTATFFILMSYFRQSLDIAVEIFIKLETFVYAIIMLQPLSLLKVLKGKLQY